MQRATRTLSSSVAACAVMLIWSGSSARADVTRSCRATYIIEVPQQPGGQRRGETVSREFTATRTANFPNTARRWARRGIELCVADHWDTRGRDYVPDSCGHRATAEIRDYPFSQLEAEITELICTANPGRPWININLLMDIRGDTGCEQEDNFGNTAYGVAVNHRVTCPGVSLQDSLGQGQARSAVPDLPNTCLPGNDLRMFTPSEASWQACARACRDFSGCRAWTYRHPTGDQPAVCRLKSAAGVQVASEACESGTR